MRATEDTSPGIATVTLEQMVNARLARLPERELGAPSSGRGRRSAPPAVGRRRCRGYTRARRRVIALPPRRGASCAPGSATAARRSRRSTTGSARRSSRSSSPDAVRAHHRALARVLEATPGADAEAIATHLFGAGERRRAAQYAERAAEKAASQLAFDRAASLYQMTLDTLPPSSPDVHRVRLRLAEVLEWAGRGNESAKVYLEAAEQASPFERVDSRARRGRASPDLRADRRRQRRAPPRPRLAGHEGAEVGGARALLARASTA